MVLTVADLSVRPRKMKKHNINSPEWIQERENVEKQVDHKICGAKNRQGRPCKRYPILGRERCRNHGGCSTGAKTEEGRYRQEMRRFKHGGYLL